MKKTVSTKLPGVFHIHSDVYRDDRGYFMELYHELRFHQEGINDRFVQVNHSHSQKNVLRGLHLQRQFPQAKLVSVIRGRIWDVAVDLRPGSTHFAQWIGVELSAETGDMLYIPRGFAHGFCVLSEEADVVYQCSDVYHPEDEMTVRWDDSDIGIQWPIQNPIVSQKDQNGIRLKTFN